jgi:hypothetical protein
MFSDEFFDALGAWQHDLARPFLREGSPAMGGWAMTDQQVTLKMTRPEALALLNASETGLRVIEALGLVKNVGLTEEAVRKLRVAAR